MVRRALFIEELFRELNGDETVVPSTPPEVIESMEQAQVITPNTSTWERTVTMKFGLTVGMTGYTGISTRF